MGREQKYSDTNTLGLSLGYYISEWMLAILIKIKSFDLNMPQWSPKVWDKTKYIKKKKKIISNQLDKTYSARKYVLVPYLKRDNCWFTAGQKCI